MIEKTRPVRVFCVNEDVLNAGDAHRRVKIFVYPYLLPEAR
jgi:hypothetical protein|nr:MAG TPA_asm: hypothetical protein [Caudoviricetes sp.]